MLFFTIHRPTTARACLLTWNSRRPWPRTGRPRAVEKEREGESEKRASLGRPGDGAAVLPLPARPPARTPHPPAPRCKSICSCMHTPPPYKEKYAPPRALPPAACPRRSPRQRAQRRPRRSPPRAGPGPAEERGARWRQPCGCGSCSQRVLTCAWGAEKRCKCGVVCRDCSRHTFLGGGGLFCGGALPSARKTPRCDCGSVDRPTASPDPPAPLAVENKGGARTWAP
jgi:hypothetical protein